MNRAARWPLSAAGVIGAAAVAFGAFGAHALRGMLDERALTTWHTAVEYQFWHALALLATAVLARTATRRRWLGIAAAAFVVGVVLFSGSLYALALGAPRMLGAITPFGGVAFIAGWLALAAHAMRDAAPQ